MEDKTIVCRDCNETFVHTVGAQEFFLEKGFTDPKLCPACRKAKKANQNQGNR